MHGLKRVVSGDMILISSKGSELSAELTCHQGGIPGGYDTCHRRFVDYLGSEQITVSPVGKRCLSSENHLTGVSLICIISNKLNSYEKT